MTASESQADKDRRILAKLVDILMGISFDGCDYEGSEIQADLVKLGIIENVRFDPDIHVDSDYATKAGDGWYVPTIYTEWLLRSIKRTT